MQKVWTLIILDDDGDQFTAAVFFRKPTYSRLATTLFHGHAIPPHLVQELIDTHSAENAATGIGFMLTEVNVYSSDVTTLDEAPDV